MIAAPGKWPGGDRNLWANTTATSFEMQMRFHRSKVNRSPKTNTSARTILMCGTLKLRGQCMTLAAGNGWGSRGRQESRGQERRYMKEDSGCSFCGFMWTVHIQK